MYIIHEKIFLSSDSLLLDQRGKNNKQLDIIYGKIYKKLKKGKQEIQNSQYYKKMYNKFVQKIKLIVLNQFYYEI